MPTSKKFDKKAEVENKKRINPSQKVSLFRIKRYHRLPNAPPIVQLPLLFPRKKTKRDEEEHVSIRGSNFFETLSSIESQLIKLDKPFIFSSRQLLLLIKLC